MGHLCLTREQGFSLVELLISMTIFAVGLLAVASMQMAAIRGNSSANSLTAATALAEGIMEEILSWNSDNPAFENDDSGRNWVFNRGESSAISKAMEGAGTYQANYAIDAGYGVANLSRIQVTVSRVDGGLHPVVTLVGFKRRK